MRLLRVFVLVSLVAGGCSGGQTGGETGLEASGGRSDTGGRSSTGGARETENTGGRTDEGTGGAGDPEGTGGEAGQTGPDGPIGAAECFEQSDCETIAEQQLAQLSEPTQSAYEFHGAECVPTGYSLDDREVNGPACACAVGDSGSIDIGPVGLGCFRIGRGGNCLWDDSEFSGCKLGETDECESLCAELEARIEADAARTFETRVISASCERYNCQNVVEIEGRCYVNASYSQGRGYDCSLGAETILERYREDTTPPPTQPLSSSLEEWLGSANTDGFVDITAQTTYSGTEETGRGFGAYAQFYSATAAASVLRSSKPPVDPLEGVDDCGVFTGPYMGGAGISSWVDIDELILIDGDHEYAIEKTSASNGNYYSYGVELTEPEVEPRYGGEYGLRGSGGGFGETFETAFRLPEALSIPLLQANSRLERGAIELTWSGQGEAPLRLQMFVSEWSLDASNSTTIECLMADDGEFTIPAEVLEAVPDGFASASFYRKNRVVPEAGNKTLAINGIVTVTHEFALGERCEQPAVAEACAAYAEKYRAALTECGNTAVPTVESLCPDSATQACHLCPEYFACAADNTLCSEDGLYTYNGGCTCP